jgi:hypothetical protein
MTEFGDNCIIKILAKYQGDNIRRGACVICKKTLDKMFIWRFSEPLGKQVEIEE